MVKAIFIVFSYSEWNALHWGYKQKYSLYNKYKQKLYYFDFFKGPFGIKIEVVDVNTVDFSGKDIGGIIFQYPDTEGSIHNFGEIISQARYIITMLKESSHWLTGIFSYYFSGLK